MEESSIVSLSFSHMQTVASKDCLFDKLNMAYLPIEVYIVLPFKCILGFRLLSAVPFLPFSISDLVLFLTCRENALLQNMYLFTI